MNHEDDSFGARDANASIAHAKRWDAIESQRRTVTITLAPGELHPRERIAYLEEELARVDAERVELARRCFTAKTWVPDEDDDTPDEDEGDA